MTATSSPMFPDLYRIRDKFRAKADAQERLARALDAMAGVTDADDMRQSYRERATTAQTLSDLAQSSADRYDSAIFALDASDGDTRLVAAADAAQLTKGFDDQLALARFLASQDGGLSEEDADRAARLFWAGNP